MSVRPIDIHIARGHWLLPMLGLIAFLTCVLFFFREGLTVMVETWFSTEEYSHGILIPFIAAFLVWQKWERIRETIGKGSWWGMPVVAISVVLNIAGKLAAVFALQQYSFVIALGGLVLCFGGARLLREVIVPLLLMVFMIPLPNFFFNTLSSQLQLISSQIGVAFIRVFGVSVYVEGNVIDLGSYKLQVVEACSGLRYLFPLMTLGFIAAYFFKAAFWKRAVVFLSSIPITILMNSIRIGTIGLMVDRWGTRMAEGFLHEFQGWVVFMCSALVMLVEIIVLTRIGAGDQSWREVFAVEIPASRTSGRQFRPLELRPPFITAASLLIAGAVFLVLAPSQSSSIIPSRASFASFPASIERWSGRRATLDQLYIDTLKFDDYVLSDFRASSGPPVNLYVAWYDSQHAGQSAHSPRSCIPGGGWHIKGIDRQVFANPAMPSGTLAVNRVQIESGTHRQVVYYWFQQRGRVITNEYLVKWYLFWDALTLHRTDGAMIRLVTPLEDGATEAAAEQQLQEFAGALAPILARYVPG